MKTHPLVGKNASELMINRQRRDSKEDKKRNDTVRSSKLSALRSTMTPIRPATSMNFPLTCRSGQRHEYIFSYFTSSPETCTLKKLLTWKQPEAFNWLKTSTWELCYSLVRTISLGFHFSRSASTTHHLSIRFWRSFSSLNRAVAFLCTQATLKRRLCVLQC